MLNSYANEMIRYGTPAVLGWGGSMSDGEATDFASWFYKYLSQHNAVSAAVAYARNALLTPDPDAP